MQRRPVLTALVAALALPAFAQTRPIRLVVPYPPGGPLDIVARALAEKVRDSLGVVIVENRPEPAETSAPTQRRKRRPTATRS